MLEDVLLHVAGAKDEEARHEHRNDGSGDWGREVVGSIDEEPALNGESERDEEEVAPNEHEAKPSYD